MTQAAPLIATKLHIPRVRARRVARPQLIKRLNAGLPFILISAPPGFGKTTLLAEWLAQTDRVVCWLSLDEHDNDPARFLHYLIGALRTADDALGATTYALLGSPEVPPADVVMAPLLNDLASLAKPTLLVLDDYHVISDMRVHQLIIQLVEFLPESLQIAIASRIDPPLPLPRLRVRGQLIEVRSADLRFTADQAAAFLNDVMGLALTPDVIDTLEARTEGWIAGLQLAALSLQEADDAQAFMHAFAGNDRHIMDYLADEVLSRQSDAVRRFLLHTSLLDRLCGPACDAVLADGATDSAATLEQLERANLFIVPLDNRREWYRYHHLFGSLLRHRLAREHAADVPDLHRRAAQWFGQQGLIEEAIKHAWPPAITPSPANCSTMQVSGCACRPRSVCPRCWAGCNHCRWIFCVSDPTCTSSSPAISRCWAASKTRSACWMKWKRRYASATPMIHSRGAWPGWWRSIDRMRPC